MKTKTRFSLMIPKSCKVPEIEEMLQPIYEDLYRYYDKRIARQKRIVEEEKMLKGYKRKLDLLNNQYEQIKFYANRKEELNVNGNARIIIVTLLTVAILAILGLPFSSIFIGALVAFTGTSIIKQENIKDLDNINESRAEIRDEIDRLTPIVSDLDEVVVKSKDLVFLIKGCEELLECYIYDYYECYYERNFDRFIARYGSEDTTYLRNLAEELNMKSNITDNIRLIYKPNNSNDKK